MANIDELHFEVILKDDDFRKRVAKDIELANKLNVGLSDALNFNKKVRIEPLNRVKQAFQDIEKSSKRAHKEQKNHNKTLNESAKVMRTLSRLTGVTFSVVGVRRFLSTLMDITGQFEVQKMALRNMLQDLDGADKIFHDLYVFSSNSTYRFSELAKHAKQLAAFNIDQESLLETTKMLGDVASGVGVSMDRIILAYGHVKSSGFLRGIQLRSFSQNGVPVLEELSKMLTEIEGKTVSLGDVFDKMMKREITFEMVEEAFKRMTSEGGKFYQMQEVLAKTLAGQINILKGKWENLMYAIGESQEGILKGVVQVLTKIVSNTENFGKAMLEGIVVLGAYRTAMIISTAATEGLAVATSKGLIGSLKKLLTFVAKNPYALLAAGAAYFVIEAVKALSALNDTEKIVKALNDTTAQFNKAQADEMRELDLLVGRLKSAREGTDEYRHAKLALEKRFDPYIQQLRNEGVAVNNLAVLYDGLAKKITAANKQRFLEDAQKAISDAYGEATQGVEDETKRVIENIAYSFRRKLTGEEEGAIRHYIATGEKNNIFSSMALDTKRGARVVPDMNGRPQRIQDEETYYEKLRALYNRNSLAADTYADAMMEAAKRFDAANAIFDDASGDGDKVYKINAIVAGIKKIDAELDKLRKKAKIGWITEDEKNRIDSLVEDREEQAKLYKSITGVDYDKSINASTTEQNNATNDRIRSLKAEMSILEKYRNTREEFKDLFGDSYATKLVSLFGDRDYDAGLDEEIKTIITDLRSLGEAGNEAADQIETRLGIDAASQMKQTARDAKKYADALKKYLGEDFSFSGSKLEYKASRILANYNTQVNDATRAYEKLIEMAKKQGDDTKKIDDQFAAELAQLAADRDNKIIELAKTIYGDETKGIDLSDWAHKSGKEIKDIISKLNSLSVDPAIAKILDKENLEALEAALRELAEADIQKALGKLDEKRLNNIKGIAESVKQMASSLKELGDASGNRTLSDTAEAISFIADTASSVIENLAHGNYAGAVIAVVTAIADEIIRAQTAAEKMKLALAEAKEESRGFKLSSSLSAGAENVFGASGIKKIQNAIANVEKLKATMQDGSGVFLYGKDNWWTPKWETMIGNLAMAVGGDLYDIYGNLNAKTLQSILDTYTTLDMKSRMWIQRAITDSEAYTEAMEQLGDVLGDVVGNIATDSASKIVDTWAAAGNAALDYKDILNEVTLAYAKMITESMLIGTVFDDDFKNRLQTLFVAGDTEGVMDMVVDGLEQVQALAPRIANALEPLRPYLNHNGSNDSLKEGINKELVEGNSSLIASYINAMRADLSVMRQMQSSGWQDVKFVRDNVPSLVDYAAQVAANTYNNAQNTQAILAKLQSIITPSTNGGSAVRTTK